MRATLAILVVTASLSSAGVFATAAAEQSRTSDQQAAGVTGGWLMEVKSPHGPVSMNLTLTQDGTKVTGTCETPHGDLRMKGQFRDGKLELETIEGEDPPIALKAKLKDDGTLDGYLSGKMGDMTWKAERAAGK